MHKLKAFLKLLGKIVHAFTPTERLVVILLGGVFVASTIQLILPAFQNLDGQEKSLYAEGLVGQPKFLNPLLVDFNDVDRDIGSLIFSGLVKYDPVQENFVPDLATFTKSKDNKTYVFSLGNNIFWHDEKPVTADDVYFTYHDVIQDPGFKNVPLHRAFEGIEVKKIDTKTVAFVLPNENSFFISYLTTGIIPVHVFKNTSIADLEKHQFNKKPIGTGPYRLPEGSRPFFERQKQLSLEWFPKYYGPKAGVRNIKFLFFQTAQEMAENHTSLKGIPKLRGQLVDAIPQERFAAYGYTLPQYMTVFFNLERPFAKNKHIRQALMKAVNKDDIVAKIGDAERIDRLYFSTAPSEWVHQFDADQAKKILNDAGWQVNQDGFRHNGKDEILSLSLLVKDFPDDTPIENETMQLVDMLRSSWQSAGVRVEIKRESGNNFQELLQKREYDLLLTGQSLGYNFDTFAFWHSTQKGSGGLNFSGLQSFRVDSLLEDLQLTFDSAQKKRKMAQLEEVISQEIPALFLYQPKYTYFMDKSITGFIQARFAFASDRFANILRMEIKKK